MHYYCSGHGILNRDNVEATKKLGVFLVNGSEEFVVPMFVTGDENLSELKRKAHKTIDDLFATHAKDLGLDLDC